MPTITTTEAPPIPGRLTTEDAAHQALEPVREFAGGYGRTKLIAESMTDLTGQPVSRQMVGRWINGTALPNLGTGLVLLLVVKHLGGRPLALGAAGMISVQLEPKTPKPKRSKK